VKTYSIYILRPIMRFPERTNERTNERRIPRTKERTKLERSKPLSPRCGTGRRDPEVRESREYQISVGRVRGRREEKRRAEERRGGGGGGGGGFRSCVCSLWRGLRRSSSSM
jgi:hypothetical protein